MTSVLYNINSLQLSKMSNLFILVESNKYTGNDYIKYIINKFFFNSLYLKF